MTISGKKKIMEPMQVKEMLEQVLSKYVDGTARPGEAEALQEAIKYAQLRIPKKVLVEPWSAARCPTCGCELSADHGDGYYSHRTWLDYCENDECHQKLDWGEYRI